MFFVFVGPKPQKFSKLMDEESPRKSLVKGERFVRHDDTSELSQPCSSNTGLRWNIQRREGELHVDLFVGKKEEKKRKGGGRGGEELCFLEMRAGRANASPPLEKLCNWPALIEELVMGVHSTGVQWPAPPQGPHLLICGSPLPGKYALRLSCKPGTAGGVG